MKKLATQFLLSLTLSASAFALSTKNALGMTAPTDDTEINVNPLLTNTPVEYNIENNMVVNNSEGFILAAPDSTKLYKIQSYFYLTGIDPRGIDGGLGGGLRTATQEYLNAYKAGNNGVLPDDLKDVQSKLNTLLGNVTDDGARTAFTDALYAHVDTHMNDPAIRKTMINKAQSTLKNINLQKNDILAAAYIADMVDKQYTVTSPEKINKDYITYINDVLESAKTPAPTKIEQAQQKVADKVDQTKDTIKESIEDKKEDIQAAKADIKESISGGGKLKLNKTWSQDFVTDGSRIVTPLAEKQHNDDGVYMGVNILARSPEFYYQTDFKEQTVKIGASTFSDGVNPHEDGYNNGNVVSRNPSLAGHTEGIKDMTGLHLNIKDQPLLGGQLTNTKIQAGITTDGNALDVFKKDAQFSLMHVATATTTFKHDDVLGRPLSVSTTATYKNDMRLDVGAQYSVIGDEKMGVDANAYLSQIFNQGNGFLFTAAADAHMQKDLSNNFNMSANLTPYWKSDNTLGANAFVGIEKGIKVSKSSDLIKVDGKAPEKKVDLNVGIGVQTTVEKTPGTDAQRTIGPVLKIGF